MGICGFGCRNSSYVWKIFMVFDIVMILFKINSVSSSGFLTVSCMSPVSRVLCGVVAISPTQNPLKFQSSWFWCDLHLPKSNIAQCRPTLDEQNVNVSKNCVKPQLLQVAASVAEGLTRLLVHLSVYRGITINYLRPLLYRPPPSLFPSCSFSSGKESLVSRSLWRHLLW